MCMYVIMHDLEKRVMVSGVAESRKTTNQRAVFDKINYSYSLGSQKVTESRSFVNSACIVVPELWTNRDLLRHTSFLAM